MVRRGQATAESRKLVRLTVVAVAIVARPGSFGIQREHFPVGKNYGLSGGIVFDHKNTYDRIAA
jgi:hypothetical protein